MSFESLPHVTVTIEIPRWSFIKYAMTEQGGHVDFISPLPCPFNYGFVEGSLGGDGQPLDAIVLGSRIRRGGKLTSPVHAIVRFVDKGETDDKLICSDRPLSVWQIGLLRAGFTIYVIMKNTMHFMRRRRGKTSFRKIDFSPESIAKIVTNAS